MKRMAALLIVVTAVLTGSIIVTGSGLVLFNVNTFAINNPVRVLQGCGAGATPRSLNPRINPAVHRKAHPPI